MVHARPHASKLNPYMDAYIYSTIHTQQAYAAVVYRNKTGLHVHVEANQECQESARLQLYSGSPV